MLNLDEYSYNEDKTSEYEKSMGINIVKSPP